MLSPLLTQCAGELLNLVELRAPHAGVPMHGRLHMASGEWQWNRTHEIDMQTGPRGVGHIDFTAVAVDPEEFAVSDQALSDVWVDVRKHARRCLIYHCCL